MSIEMNRALALGVAALGLFVLAQPVASAAKGSDGTRLAQATSQDKGEEKGQDKDQDKDRRDGARRPSEEPNGDTPTKSAPIPPSPVLRNAPQSGVPARCASFSDPAELQKCMNTPKGQ